MKKTHLKVFVPLFLFFLACGTTSPDIDPSDCPQEDPNSTVSSTSMVSVSSSAIGSGGSSTISSSVVASTGVGGMMMLPNYETPGADEIISRLHSCHKLTYAQLGNLLRGRGVAIPTGVLSDLKNVTVNIFGMPQTLSQIFGGSGQACEMADTTANGSGQVNDPLCASGETCFCNQDDKTNEVNKTCLDVGNNSPDAKDGYCVAKIPTAGYLYFTGKNALGVPKLDSRLSEKEEHTTASAMKLMDIFVQSAQQIINNIGDPVKAPACTLNGKNLPMFDPVDGSCVEESVSCLIGQPASDDHILLCNLIIQKAKQGDQSDLNKKRIIAVSTLLSAAHSCQ
jgi:hypothetical protein